MRHSRWGFELVAVGQRLLVSGLALGYWLAVTAGACRPVLGLSVYRCSGKRLGLEVPEAEESQVLETG